jgi:hypothetical protein
MSVRLIWFGTVLGCAAIAGAAEDYSAWTYARDLSVDASPTGANLTADLTGFPLAISLGSESSELFTQAKPDGSDLRFAAEDGSHLAYQIEAWDAAAKKGLVWVRLPVVKAALIQHVKAYWGRASAADSSSGPGVFRSQDGFQGVWHMASMADASPNAVQALDSGTAADAAGRLGPARAFPNADAYAAKGAFLSLGNPAPLNLKGVIALEAWVKWARRDGHRIIVCHGAAPGMQAESQYETVLRIGETLDYRAGTWTGKAHYAMATAAPADSAVWIHLAGVFDGTGWALYRNGARVASLASDTNGAKPSAGNWRIGAEYTSTGITRYFSGSLDEVRINSVARSEDWFKFAYATQKDGQTIVKWGGPTGIRRMAPARMGRAGAGRAGIWPAPKSPEAGFIDALGARLPSR